MAFAGYNPFLASSSYLPSFSAGFSSPYNFSSGYSFPSAATYSAPTFGGYPFGGAGFGTSNFGPYGSYSPAAQSSFSSLLPTAPTVAAGGAYSGSAAYGSAYTPGASPFLLGGPKAAAGAAPTVTNHGPAPTAPAGYPFANAYAGFGGAYGNFGYGGFSSPYAQRYPFAAAPGPINPYHQPRHVAPQPAPVPIRRSEYKDDYSDTSSNYSGYSGYYSN
eukprot:TRINITY_DN10958_c0_g1_i1.p1 TRINITY_DN10958_c0_g1~~TRINITY_DN10958_c0_g1_i1.p1  ORF type:complete len:218 (-),score=21.47 TRINITY_DN10958_c0_g1_i1:123-776(-)